MPHNRSYSEQIDLKIKYHEEQIKELQIAKQVIGKLVHPNEPTTLGAPVTKKVIRRGPHIQKQLINEIADVMLYKAEPVFSRDIIDALERRGVSVPKKQRVWAALSVMKKDGVVQHIPEDGTYVLRERKGETNTKTSEAANVHHSGSSA